MAIHIRKLVIIALAILAFAASNFAMVSSGMAHGGDAAGHHLTIGACEAVHSLSLSGQADDHGCKPKSDGMCDDGPTCCSNACQALLMVSSFAAFREMAEPVEASAIAGHFRATSTYLERPPRS